MSWRIPPFPNYYSPSRIETSINFIEALLLELSYLGFFSDHVIFDLHKNNIFLMLLNVDVYPSFAFGGIISIRFKTSTVVDLC